MCVRSVKGNRVAVFWCKHCFSPGCLISVLSCPSSRTISLPISSLFFVLSLRRSWCLRCVSILMPACFSRILRESSKFVDRDLLEGSESREGSLETLISNSREPSGKKTWSIWVRQDPGRGRRCIECVSWCNTVQYRFLQN